MSHIKWKEAPEGHDYEAAESYLSLIFLPELARDLVRRLRHAPMTEYCAKDIFRASKEDLLGISNKHIKKNIEKIEAGKELSPLLLVREKGRVIIADGYHRVCTVYRYDEDAKIRCKIV